VRSKIGSNTGCDVYTSLASEMISLVNHQERPFPRQNVRTAFSRNVYHTYNLWNLGSSTDLYRLTTGIRCEKCVVRRFRRCANVIQCTYTNPDSTVEPTADMRRLTTGIRSEKSVVRRFRRCANVIQCTYTNPDSTV